MIQQPQLIKQIKQCQICNGKLPYPPKPIFQYSPKSRIVIAGQAPGDKTHQQGRPFDDKSGDRLRVWLGVSKEIFYNPAIFSHLPMAMCFPGSGKSGDLAPPKICAETWRTKLFDNLEHAELIIVLGKYSLAWHQPNHKGTLTQAIKQNDFASKLLVLPHPSPRNNLWLKKNPWFDRQLVELKRKVGGILNAT